MDFKLQAKLSGKSMLVLWTLTTHFESFWSKVQHIPSARLKSFPRHDMSDVKPFRNLSEINRSSTVNPVSAISSTVICSRQSSVENTCRALTFKLDTPVVVTEPFSWIFTPHPASMANLSVIKKS